MLCHDSCILVQLSFSTQYLPRKHISVPLILKLLTVRVERSKLCGSGACARSNCLESQCHTADGPVRFTHASMCEHLLLSVPVCPCTSVPIYLRASVPVCSLWVCANVPMWLCASVPVYVFLCFLFVCWCAHVAVCQRACACALESV